MLSRSLQRAAASKPQVRLQVEPVVALVDASSGMASELRWMPATEVSSDSSGQARASWSVRAALLAQQIPGWSYVPASVDSWGQREPAYLYASGDIAGCKKRVDALRAALEKPLPSELLSSVSVQRRTFARAQLTRERFRLHAMHGGEGAGFESELAALEQLGAGTDADEMHENEPETSAHP